MLVPSVSAFEANPCVIAIEDIHFDVKRDTLGAISMNIFVLDFEGITTIEQCNSMGAEISGRNDGKF